MRVRELPPQQNDSDQDKETGWWPEKEADEEAAAVGVLSVDIQVDAIEEVTPDISRMVPMTGGVRMNVIADKLASHGSASDGCTAVFPTLHCGDIVEAPMRIKCRSDIATPGRGSMRTTCWRKGSELMPTCELRRSHDSSESDASLQQRADRAAQLQCRIYAAQSWASGRMLELCATPGRIAGFPRHAAEPG